MAYDDLREFVKALEKNKELTRVSIEVDPLDRITIIGPGAGKELAGQGILADLIAVASKTGVDRR